jgi:hypothetical protein
VTVTGTVTRRASGSVGENASASVRVKVTFDGEVRAGTVFENRCGQLA